MLKHVKVAFEMDRAGAWDVFRQAPYVALAGADGDGFVLQKIWHSVVVGDSLVFHAGRHGEKQQLLERECVVTAQQVVANVPSYFIDPELACPATTYYRSAQLRGRLERVVELDEKFEVLRHLMQRYQPEGGFEPLASGRRYDDVVRGLLVMRLRCREITGKAKLGQNRGRRDIENVLLGLWNRGTPGDLAAIDAIRRAHPARLDPEFLRAPASVELVCAPTRADSRGAADLLVNQYWTEGESHEVLARAQRESDAWVVARCGTAVVATARSVGDGVRWAHVKDVAVAARARGAGLGDRIVRLLMNHPRVRNARRVHLATRDAVDFYARHGFRRCPSDFYEMIRER